MTNKETAYKKISELVERFEEQYTSYKKSEYNETLTRRDFIDPFFKALGWDIDNEQGYAEAYREVIHEDKIKIGGATKAPDYSFRVGGGKRLFFVEAKKPSVVVKDDILPAYQVRRYGWSAKLSISLITDFEEFAIYDCTKKPIPTDKASVARVKYITFRDYLKEFDFIWDTFSKERVLQGSFDKFILGTANKKGTATVDKEFLQSLDSWRTYLATSISWNNKDLDEDEINFAVQQTIDRIIFLRIAEDRSIEPYGNLKTAIKQGEYYKNLFSVFREADEKYNSGLFDFKKDRISKNLNIDNKVIKTIVNELYYPESPYEFSVLSVEILGSAYEQFLGKVIRVDKAHRAHIEEKPEVRKAGGVYYTPQYVVEYIVKNTIGKLIDGKTPKEISQIKIVDPACGSGSFLIGAYQYLLDWHKNYYSDNGKPSKGKKDNPLTPEGNLTTGEKKRILLNNIFGVDIDVNAVEVTKLSLLLKCMEGETQASISQQLKMFNERVLPTLDSNIKDGNSLVDTDFYSTQLDFGEEKKIKPFNWQKGFPEVFKQGGFDAVIGNPPYFGINSLDKTIVKYLATHYSEIHTGYNDIMYYFIFKGISLLKNDGVCGLITSNYFLGNKYAEPLRKFLVKHLVSIINFKNYFVFNGVSIHTSIILLNKANSLTKVLFYEPLTDEINKTNIEESCNRLELKKSELGDTWIIGLRNELSLIEKLKKQTPLGEIAIIEKGSTSGKNNVFTVPKEFASQRKFEKEILRKNIKNGDIGKYSIFEREQYLIYVDSKTDIKKYPNIYKYLEENKSELQNRNEVKQKLYDWFRLERPRKKEVFDSEEKIVVPYRAESNRFAYDNSQYFNDGGDIRAIVINKNLSTKYVLGILNSNLINWFYGFIGKPKENSREYFNEPLSQIPIPVIEGKKDNSLYKEIIKLVDQLLILNKEKADAKLETKISQLQGKIEYCESRINEIVYQLYELTPSEIKIVEGK